MIAAARMTTWDWLALVVVASALPVFYVARVELERWRLRRRSRRRRGAVDLRDRRW